MFDTNRSFRSRTKQQLIDLSTDDGKCFNLDCSSVWVCGMVMLENGRLLTLRKYGAREHDRFESSRVDELYPLCITELPDFGCDLEIMRLLVHPRYGLTVLEQNHRGTLVISIPQLGQFRIVLLLHGHQSGSVRE